MVVKNVWRILKMPRKTNEERLADTQAKLKLLRAKIKKEKLQFRRALADDLLKTAETTEQMTYTSDTVVEIEKLKTKIADTTDYSAKVTGLTNEIKKLNNEIENLRHEEASKIVMVPFSFNNVMPQSGNHRKITCILTSEKCPCCDGMIVKMKDTRGQQYECCTNSTYWGWGTCECNFNKR